jgi:hypothetical protein
MIESTLKKECKDAFNRLLKIANESDIQALTRVLSVWMDEVPAWPIKKEILPYKEIAGLKVFNGGKS